MKIDHSSVARALQTALTNLPTHLSLVGKESTERVAVVGPIGSALNTLPPEDLDEDIVHPYLMALEYARISEAQGPGSLRACLVYAERLIRGALQTPHTLVGRSFVANDIMKLLTGNLDYDDAMTLTGFVTEAGASRYVVERTPSRYNSVEFVDTYEFKHTSKPVEGTVVMDNARILVADGYVENVAEIHTILDRAGREKERLLICGRGFSDDVLHTLAVNRARGTLVAYGLTFPFDENDANTLVDIATIVGGDVVSSIKGQLYNTVDFTLLPRVPYARLRGQTLDFRGSGSPARIAQVLNDLQKKAAESEEPTRSILDKRVRRLAGSCMIIRLADGTDHMLRSEAWDLALRSLKAATKGVVDVTDAEAWPGRTVIPLVSLATAHEMARKLISVLKSIDSCI
jgi:hypothetical protein